ncbi:hypothetical protein F5050DRAFT_1714357 [Lentinula boryana]|uniref:Uncharacterized protein n=1 Tax=Lentinula boryana TaxID=40481 RepID=A0ABQ8Q575_9AGAR|nr:hypothetical protein F5050DRAFT_1714357 [Lentinula boryana]
MALDWLKSRVTVGDSSDVIIIIIEPLTYPSISVDPLAGVHKYVDSQSGSSDEVQEHKDFERQADGSSPRCRSDRTEWNRKANALKSEHAKKRLPEKENEGTAVLEDREDEEDEEDGENRG